MNNIKYLLAKAYIKNLFDTYSKEENADFSNIVLPEMNFIFKIEIDDTDDLVNNIAPFLKLSNLEDKIGLELSEILSLLAMPLYILISPFFKYKM